MSDINAEKPPVADAELIAAIAQKAREMEAKDNLRAALKAATGESAMGAAMSLPDQPAPMTMTANQETDDRDFAELCVRMACGETVYQGDRLVRWVAEVDALRTSLARVEAERDEERGIYENALSTEKANLAGARDLCADLQRQLAEARSGITAAIDRLYPEGPFILHLGPRPEDQISLAKDRLLKALRGTP